ncbi:MAG TPA: FAD-dependent oxidoreductase [Myxococcota bacterium]|nr:FAD-dependent oxidoreductase [Myxococcota bacterium]
MRIVVIGGGVAGLGAAHFLARDGHDVTVLERDATPLPATPAEAFAHWDRRGAPQVRHSHAFLARLRNLLRDRAPDLLAALLASGAAELPFGEFLPPTMADRSPRPGDLDLVMLACRRVTFEWVLRREALRQPRIAFRDGAEVRGLRARGEGAALRVHGVEIATEDGAALSLDADYVVDAAGRRSKLPAWLEAIGVARPREEAEDCGIYYVSRFYRLRGERPTGETTIAGDLGYVKYAVFHGDSGIFSVTFAASPDDAPLRALLREKPFAAAAEAIPAVAPWVSPGVAEPISDVHGMGNLRNVRRFLVEDGRPLAPGVLAIGDAAIHTNPLYGRGCTFALVYADALAQALRAHGDDAVAAALALDAAIEREIVPWYKISVAQDRDAIEVAARWRHGEDPDQVREEGGVVDPKSYMRSLIRYGLIPALARDPDLSRAFFRSFNVMDPPGDLLKDPTILMKVLGFYQTRAEREEVALGPGRAALVDLLARAV